MNLMSVFDSNDPEQAAENLQFIKDIMQSSRVSLDRQAPYFLIWGTLMSAGAGIQAYSVISDSLKFNAVLTTYSLAFFLSFIISFQNRGRRTNYYKAQNISGVLWYSIGFTIGLLSIADNNLHSNSGGLTDYNPVIASLLGIGTFVSGHLANRVIYRLSGIGWWISSVLFFRTSRPYSDLLMSAAILIFMALPAVSIMISGKKSIREFLNL
jgi:hypothetical protein